jgi:hypothetical protein
MTKSTLLLILALCTSGTLLAQGKVPADSKVFIAPMEGQLDGFIPPEIQKRHLPIRVILDENQADFIMTGMTSRAGSAWYDVIAGGVIAGKDKFEANVKLVSVKDKTLVWSASAGDRSVVFGAFRRGGQRKIAERIVKQMEKDLFGNY